MKEKKKKVNVNDDVYPPSEDTFLLLESIRSAVQGRVLEVGSGTGYVSVHIGNRVDTLIGCDISLSAARNTQENLLRNSLIAKSVTIQSDLFLALQAQPIFDVIIFNPPYLPDDENSTENDDQYIGGNIGTEKTEEFLVQAVERLNPNGSIFVVVSSLADAERVKDRMDSLSLSVDVVGEKALFFEKLQVLRGVLS